MKEDFKSILNRLFVLVKIQDENERLKTENLGMRIKVLKEEELANELLFSTPTDFIEEEIIDDELTDWNRGFLC